MAKKTKTEKTARKVPAGWTEVVADASGKKITLPIWMVEKGMVRQPKKMGRPPTGESGPVLSIRLPPETVAEIDTLVKKVRPLQYADDDKVTRTGVIRHLITYGLLDVDTKSAKSLQAFADAYQDISD